MFEQLFASRIVEKVLFYMIANKKCFASELRQCFGIPIFGIQRALTRLGNQGILVSIIEGNNRIYHWNPRYPFIEEFKRLIEKAYSSLPEEFKKIYCERVIRRRPRKQGKTRRQNDEGNSRRRYCLRRIDLGKPQPPQ